MKKLILSILVFVLVAMPVMSQEQMGSIHGKVTTADGKAIVDAKVTVSSPSLIRALTATTDEKGRFRFPRLPIGEYKVNVKAEQYKTYELEGLIVRIGSTVTVNPLMEVGAFEEVLTITGDSPLIDVSSTEVGEVISKELLTKLPQPRFPTDIVAMSAGNVGGDSDYGSTMGGSGRSNAYKLDGIDVSDPGTGTVWVFVNMESIEEMEVLPISGANADVGGFTGAALNMVTKSGGNDFSGGLSYYFFNEDFITWNTDDEGLRADEIRESYNNDFTGYVGGPIMQDKAWFFVNGGRRLRERLLDDQVLTYEYRNTMWKASTVLSDSMNLYGTFHYDNYLREGRGAAYNYAPEATFDQEGPNKSFAIDYTWAINEDNLFDVKFHGWDGYFALVGNGEGPQFYDVDNDFYSNNGDGDYRTDRNRYNLVATLSNYQKDLFGDHEFKFGVEYQRGQQQTLWYWDVAETVGGEFDFRYGAFPNFFSKNRVEGYTFYGLDSWSVNERLTINYGIRFETLDYVIPDQEPPGGGTIAGLDTVHTFKNWAPRFGFTYQLDEAGSTVVRGSAGRYYEGVFSFMFEKMTPSDTMYQEFVWDGADWALDYEEPYSSPDIYTVDEDLGGLYTDAFTLGFEHELMPNISVSADYVHREYKDYPVIFDEGRDWTPVDLTFEGTTYTVYSREGDDLNFVYRNSEELFSDYDAVILRATKRYSNNWQLQASLTLSRLYGNAEKYDGDTADVINADLEYHQDPNRQINAEGLQYAHRPWNLKVNGTYTFPYDISVSTIMSYAAGPYWTPLVRLDDDRLGQNNVEILAEERGQRSLDDQFVVDVRAEKVFAFDRYRASLLVDIYNMFNSGAVDDIVVRIDQSDFESPVSVIGPRRFQVGVRFSF